MLPVGNIATFLLCVQAVLGVLSNTSCTVGSGQVPFLVWPIPFCVKCCQEPLTNPKHPRLHGDGWAEQQPLAGAVPDTQLPVPGPQAALSHRATVAPHGSGEVTPTGGGRLEHQTRFP